MPRKIDRNFVKIGPARLSFKDTALQLASMSLTGLAGQITPPPPPEEVITFLPAASLPNNYVPPVWNIVDATIVGRFAKTLISTRTSSGTTTHTGLRVTNADNTLQTASYTTPQYFNMREYSNNRLWKDPFFSFDVETLTYSTADWEFQQQIAVAPFIRTVVLRRAIGQFRRRTLPMAGGSHTITEQGLQMYDAANGSTYFLGMLSLNLANPNSGFGNNEGVVIFRAPVSGELSIEPVIDTQLSRLGFPGGSWYDAVTNSTSSGGVNPYYFLAVHNNVAWLAYNVGAQISGSSDNGAGGDTAIQGQTLLAYDLVTGELLATSGRGSVLTPEAIALTSFANIIGYVAMVDGSLLVVRRKVNGQQAQFVAEKIVLTTGFPDWPEPYSMIIEESVVLATSSFLDPAPVVGVPVPGEDYVLVPIRSAAGVDLFRAGLDSFEPVDFADIPGGLYSGEFYGPKNYCGDGSICFRGRYRDTGEYFIFERYEA